MTSPCPVKTLGQIALPGVAFSNFLGAECWFAAPNTSHAGEAGIPINLVDPDNTTARLVAKKLQVNWGHVSAPQLKRILPDADGVGATKLKVADFVVGERDVCAAFDKAPRPPLAGASLASALNDLLSLDYVAALHPMDPFSRSSVLVPASPKNPPEEWGAFTASRITVFGKPRCLQMDSGGE